MLPRAFLRVYVTLPEPTHLLAALQQRQPLGGGQRITPQIQGTLQVGFERVEDLDDLFPATRTRMCEIITARSDTIALPVTTETTVTQVISVAKVPMAKWSP